MYAAEVLADSISGQTGTRLFTVQATFPRFILAEVNTHRVFSRNSASSRAIPPEIHIKRIAENPFMPEAFHKRVKGMGQGEALDKEAQKEAREKWIKGSQRAITTAEALLELDISKSHVNRVLEPYMWHTAIITSTEWDNFFNLRTPPGDEIDYDFPAQPEFQKIGIMMRNAMRASNPTLLATPDDWHTPLVAEDEEFDDFEEWTPKVEAEISAGRCAKVSYEKMGFEAPIASLVRTSGLTEHGHMSPLEHAARIRTSEEDMAMRSQKDVIRSMYADGTIDKSLTDRLLSETEFVGNFRNFVQLRKTVEHEEDRVGFLEERDPWWAQGVAV